ncbi:MAG: phosphate ABC transporter ATP-binding protein [Chloroflexota bacterium]
MTEFVYTLKNLLKQYEDRTVLQVDQLHIRAGEILAIVGPSGAGKSTLLRHLNFLEQPTSGEIIYYDTDWEGSEPPLAIRRKITTVFQTTRLLSRSVTANVAFGLQVRGKRKSETDQAVYLALTKVGLQDLADKPAHTLSGGEVQRLALARALVIQPQVLLLDEPTANLDPYNVRLFEETVTATNQDRDVTVVFVTHNLFQARRIAHRVAFLFESRLIEVADTATFFENPTDPRTAAFVRGDMVY